MKLRIEIAIKTLTRALTGSGQAKSSGSYWFWIQPDRMHISDADCTCMNAVAEAE
jgi:hypothetical protein